MDETSDRRSLYESCRQDSHITHEDEDPTILSQTTLSQQSLYQSAADLCELQLSPICSSNDGKSGRQNAGMDIDPEKLQEVLSQIVPDKNPNLYFVDGRRKIDFVLVWESADPLCVQSCEKRRIFEKNLEREGLQLEYDSIDRVGLNVVKIYAPLEIMQRYAEILKLRMPMKEIPQLIEKVRDNAILSEMRAWFRTRMEYFQVDPMLFPPKGQRFTAEYSRDKDYLFAIDGDDCFAPALRARVVFFILSRKRFVEEDSTDHFAFGIERLLNDHAYTCAYPLHDGDFKTPGTMRYLLGKEWATLRKILKLQPLDYVKQYFGVKIGLYFAWLGFYTFMLIPASIVGLLCFVYSCATLGENKPSDDICDRKVNVTMCPMCDHFCDFWDLQQTCAHSKVTYLFDNPSTVFFAIFMSLWGALFLELWKRYSAEITYRWDLTGFDAQDEHPRPQYLARLANVRKQTVNVITNSKEPAVPFWRMKFPAFVFSTSLVLLLIILALAAVVGVILYRMSVLAALYIYSRNDAVITSYALIITTGTAACINLVCILIFNRLYNGLAEYLSEIELHRTQTEFDDALTLKYYLLQFVNYYASIFYVAFFKGQFVGYPRNYNRFFDSRQEECGPGGCLLELSIQLIIIMVGKQAMNNIIETLYPLISKWWRSVRVKPESTPTHDLNKLSSQWAKDFRLADWGRRALFPEYLEMVLQYGFVTIFVAAFPLAPLFALLNNVLEVRLDARKLLFYHRRPVGQRVKDIGVWYRILDSIGKLAVVTNGFIIAFTSEFIPRLVYRYTISGDGSLEGYLDHSLARFNPEDFDNMSVPLKNPKHGYQECRYHDYREPPDSPNAYAKTDMFWRVLVARLTFVVVFENVVAVVIILVNWLIPDVPRSLRDQIRREAYITNEIVIKQEMIRSRGLIGGGDSTGWNPVTDDHNHLDLIRPTGGDVGEGDGARQRRRKSGRRSEDGDEDSQEVML